MTALTKFQSRNYLMKLVTHYGGEVCPSEAKWNAWRMLSGALPNLGSWRCIHVWDACNGRSKPDFVRTPPFHCNCIWYIGLQWSAFMDLKAFATPVLNGDSNIIASVQMMEVLGSYMLEMNWEKWKSRKFHFGAPILLSPTQTFSSANLYISRKHWLDQSFEGLVSCLRFWCGL